MGWQDWAIPAAAGAVGFLAGGGGGGKTDTTTTTATGTLPPFLQIGRAHV